MNFDWNIIGKKVSSLYEEMEYQSDYNINQFLNDFKTEIKKKVEIPAELSEFEGDFLLIQLVKNSFDKRRSIFTKLFSLTNNPNGVDMLIEYCDYYLSHCFDSEQEYITTEGIDRLMHMIQEAFLAIARDETPEGVLDNIWKMFYMNIGLSSSDSYEHASLAYWDRTDRLAMVIMADSDLNAAVQALIKSYNTHYGVSKVLVQEPIKEQLLNTLRNEEIKDRILSNLFVFRNTDEALGNLNGKDKIEALSIWSENIIAAKKFSANAQTDTIWINALGLVDFGLHSIHNFITNNSFRFNDLSWAHSSHQSSETHIKGAKKYDHFYGGKWQNPDNGKYWTHKTGDSIAEATKKDFENCANAAREAFKVWRSTKLSQRVKVMRCFAERLQANGESKYADIVLKHLHRPLDFGTSLSIVRDGEAEILTTPEPVGVIAIGSNNRTMLFTQLTIASVTGNAVAVVLDRESYMSFAPYCDLLGTCGFPPGLISCIFTTDEFREDVIVSSDYFDRILPDSLGDSNIKFLDPYKHTTTEHTLYINTFIYVTKPKSVWIPLN